MNKVKDKVVLITGGASGIGRSAALLLAQQGAQVIVTDINEADGAKVVEEIADAGGEALFLGQDVTSEADWASVVDAIRSRYGRLDTLVNNAGGGTICGLETLTLDVFRKDVGQNLESIVLSIQYALPLLKNNPAGASIINIASIAGTVGETDLPAYSVAKAGVRQLTRVLAMHCIERGYKVRANGIYPGLINTPLLQSALAVFDLNEPKSVTRRIGLVREDGRIGQPEDVANAILYLASDDSRFVNGLELTIDGGISVI